MKYVSTRGDLSDKSFDEVLLMGVTKEGGLTMPVYYPKFDASQLEVMQRSMSYADLAFEVLFPYVEGGGVIGANVLQLLRPLSLKTQLRKL